MAPGLRCCSLIRYITTLLQLASSGMVVVIAAETHGFTSISGIQGAKDGGMTEALAIPRVERMRASGSGITARHERDE